MKLAGTFCLGSHFLAALNEPLSGKSTQLPSFILEDHLSRGQHCKIVVLAVRHKRYGPGKDESMRSPSPIFHGVAGLGLEFSGRSPSPEEISEDRWHRRWHSSSARTGTKQQKYRREYPDYPPPPEQYREGSSDLEVPDAHWRAGAAKHGKKRKLEEDDNITDDLERSIADDESVSTRVNPTSRRQARAKAGRHLPHPQPAATEPRSPRG